MRIAFLTPYLPYPPDTGGKIRSFNLLKQMARQHEVDVFTVHYADQPPGIDALAPHCAHLYLFPLVKAYDRLARLKRLRSPIPRSVDHFHTPESVQVVRAQLSATDYDLIFVDELVMAIYTTGLRAPPRILAQQKIDYHHYWETATARPWGQEKILDYLEYVKLRRFQAHVLHDAYALHLVCSSDDEQYLRRINPDIHIVIMPNGVDTSAFADGPARAASEPNAVPTLIYAGTMHYYPNIDAIAYFWREIYPQLVSAIPDVRILIVGHNPPPQVQQLQAYPNVIVTGSVPDVRPYLAQSTAMIVPLRLGGGTRLKIMEAMASGVPVISTSIGCQGLAVRDGQDILIADDPRAFAAQTIALLRNPSLARQLATQARLVAAQYDWGVLVQKLIGDWQVGTSPWLHVEAV